MTATYTFDVFSTLDGFGSATDSWPGYWGKQGPELLAQRLALYGMEQRMVFGRKTYQEFARMLTGSTEESEVRDPWVTRMRNLPATVLSSTLRAPLDWPDATVLRGDAAEVVTCLKEESEVPLRSHGSLSLNRALMAAGLVDRVQVTLLPSSRGRPACSRSSRAQPTSTWSWSRARRSTVRSRSSFTCPGSTDLPPRQVAVVGTGRRSAMRKLHAWLFMTLDGVIEAPEHWVLPDDAMFAAAEADYATADALLLGRRTYETFAASWPERGSEIPNADWMNKTTKYVASTTLQSPTWNNTTVIEGDVAETIARLKQEDGENILVNGSGVLVRSLLRDQLLDELRLYVHPTVVGSGTRLFEDGSAPAELTLTDSQAYDNGVVSLTYRPGQADKA